MANSDNPRRGKAFQVNACKALKEYFKVDFETEVAIPIGDPPKPHHFDFVSDDRKYVGESKCYSWTETGNTPSAKMGFMNEAAFYLSFINANRFIIMKRAIHPKRKETLAQYYKRTNFHLIKGIVLLEYDEERDIIKEII